MEIFTPFITPVFKFKADELVNEVNEIFNSEKDYEIVSKGFLTTLSDYNTKQKSIAGINNLENKIKLSVYQIMKESGYNLNYNIVIDKIWLNDMEANSEHTMHIHYGKVFSGCFYVNVPEGSGHIVFKNPVDMALKAPIDVDNFTAFNANLWTFNVEKGDMFIWHSYLAHTVPPLIYEGKRKSVAFDIMLEKP